MNARATALFPLLLLTALAAMTYWLDRAVQFPSGPRDGSNRHDPDYFVERLAAVRMGIDGKPEHTLAASRMVHYPDDDTTELAQPRFQRFHPTQPPVTISGRRGLVSGNGDHVHFYEDVRVVRAASAQSGELVLTTDYLHLIPDSNLAKTHRPVTVTDPDTRITAVGMELDSEARVVRLLSEVRGTHVRKR